MPEVTECTVKADGDQAEQVDITPNANGTSKNGVSSSSPEKKSPEKNEAEVLLAQGKRHLFIKDYPNAVSDLGSACAKLDEMYGYLADECADAYFSYGRALLELAREDSNVLGTEPEAKEDSEAGEEDEEGEGDEKKDEEKEKKDEDGEKEEEDESENNDGKEEKTPADESIDTTKEGNEEEEDKDENVETLQLAWEVFEIAKKIFERQNAKDKLADTYLYLGEVQMESENYNGAIDDLRRCLGVQKEILPPDHRDIAETYFQVGVAYSLFNEFDLAMLNFKTCLEILENRIKNLEKNGAPKEETEKNPFYSVEKEISEIKALLPEIKAKVADMEDFKRETIKSIMMASFNSQLANADGAGASSSSAEPVAPTPSTNGTTSKPINNISHLVRKKRKPEEENASETSVKKSCTDDTNK